MATTDPKATLLADWQKVQHNPLARFLLFVVYAGFIAVVGLIPAWLLDWNHLVLAAVITTAATTFLIGCIEALRELEIQRGNALGAQLLGNLEQEVLSWHGMTPEIVNNLKQLALTVAPDLLQAVEGHGAQPPLPPNRFPNQPPDMPIPVSQPLTFGSQAANPTLAPPLTGQPLASVSGGALPQEMRAIPSNWANQPVRRN